MKNKKEYKKPELKIHGDVKKITNDKKGVGGDALGNSSN